MSQSADRIIARLNRLGVELHISSYTTLHRDPMTEAFNRHAGEDALTWWLVTDVAQHHGAAASIGRPFPFTYKGVRYGDSAIAPWTVGSHVPATHLLAQPLNTWELSVEDHFRRLRIDCEKLPESWLHHG